MKKVLITVCGRAGSKGFKNKNLKVFLDKPLVYYTLASAFHFAENAKDARVDVCLNTDSEDLKNLVLAKYPEVTPIDRPEELGGDMVPKFSVLQHSLLYMEEKQGYKYDYLIDLDITSPLRQIHDVLGIYEMKKERPDAGLILSACTPRRNAYFNQFHQIGEYVGRVVDTKFAARQQVPRVYDINASMYAYETDFVRTNKTGNLLDTNCLVYMMKDTCVLDIDSEEDFEMMQLIGGYLFTNEDGFKAVKELIRD